MTQEQFNTIVKVIQKGAPALADELVGSLQNLVVSYQKLTKENEELQLQLNPSTKPDPSENPEKGGK